VSQLLDVIGSSVIAGFVILMILTINTEINDSSREMFNETFNQRSAITTGEVMEYDLYKIGYRISGSKILIADSNQIKYRTDVDNNNSADTVFYYTGSTSDASQTTNSSDYPLYRLVNNGTPKLTGIITEFNLVYYDSLGSQIGYGALNSQTQRDLVKTIKASVKYETAEQVDGYYQTLDWSRTIRPKNLNN
jgi:hypothetical protein